MMSPFWGQFRSVYPPPGQTRFQTQPYGVKCRLVKHTFSYLSEEGYFRALL